MAQTDNYGLYEPDFMKNFGLIDDILFGKRDKHRNEIVLAEGNLMRADGSVKSLSPYDIDRAEDYDPKTKKNLTDPTSTPETVLVFWGTQYFEPGAAVYDGRGELVEVPVTLKVTDLQTGVETTVADYNRSFLTNEQLDTKKVFRKMDHGVYLLEYSATVCGKELTAERYVKLRYPRGDANLDGKVSSKKKSKSYTSDLDALVQYSAEENRPFFEYESGKIDSDFLNSACDINKDGRCNKNDQDILIRLFEGLEDRYVQDFEPVGRVGNWYDGPDAGTVEALNEKQYRPISSIVLAEGNLMRADGSVKSLSPYDVDKAEGYNPETKKNPTDPTTTPETVLVFWGTQYFDPGAAVYDGLGELAEVPVTLKVTDLQTGVETTVADYNRSFLTNEQLNTRKKVRRMTEGVYKLEYLAVVDNEELTAVRYVKLRYLRGDANMDGKISARKSEGSYVSDSDAISLYAAELNWSDYEYEPGKRDIDFIRGVCDANRDGNVNEGDSVAVDERLLFSNLDYHQDFIPVGPVELNDMIDKLPLFLKQELDKKYSNPVNRIALAEGNLMRADGTVLSLSPYDISKAATYNVATKKNIDDPTTVPKTVLVYYGMPFIDPGVTVYDKQGKIADVPVKVTVTDMETGVETPVENYNRRTLTRSQLKTNKTFRKLEKGVYKLTYEATVDEEDGPLTATRYVKLRYLRGDANLDGIISPDIIAGSSDKSIIQGIVVGDTSKFQDAAGTVEQDFIDSVCDVDRSGHIDGSDVAELNKMLFGMSYYQDFTPIGNPWNCVYQQQSTNA